jgi:hypothetical protein
LKSRSSSTLICLGSSTRRARRAGASAGSREVNVPDAGRIIADGLMMRDDHPALAISPSRREKTRVIFHEVRGGNMTQAMTRFDAAPGSSARPSFRADDARIGAVARTGARPTSVSSARPRCRPRRVRTDGSHPQPAEVVSQRCARPRPHRWLNRGAGPQYPPSAPLFVVPAAVGHPRCPLRPQCTGLQARSHTRHRVYARPPPSKSKSPVIA